MRGLRKMSPPSVLDKNGKQWTDAYVKAEKAERKKLERWRHREIKAVLNDETSGRCAYCESKMQDVSYPHVEHIKPKAHFPQLAHRWENLTSACSVCNQNKGEYWNEACLLLNPYEDDPSEHLFFLSWIAQHRLTSTRGQMTIYLLGLNRIDLARSREERLEKLGALLAAWAVAESPIRELLYDSIIHDAANGEYPSAVNHYLVAHQFPFPEDDE